MSEALDRLKKIGAQKIYEETHIPVEHVQAIIHGSFDGFSKVQFLGFISILEREYNEDLSELRKDGLENFQEDQFITEEQNLFVVPKRKKSLTLLYISLAILVFIGVAYINMSSSEKVDSLPAVDNSLIQDVQKNIDTLDINESNSTAVEDLNSSQDDANMSEEIIVEEPIVHSLKFVTRTKLWLGYIDLETNKHYNKVFKGEFELDAQKGWLILLGHSVVDIVVNEKIVETGDKEHLRYLYKDGEIEAISLREFKRHNKGRTW